jgi:hypothetical protein
MQKNKKKKLVEETIVYGSKDYDYDDSSCEKTIDKIIG